MSEESAVETQQLPEKETSLLGGSKIFLAVVLFLMFALGLAIRLYDLTDEPLDFHPTRQLRSAIIARSLYAKSLPPSDDWRQMRAADQYAGYGLIEPLVFETLVADTYKVIHDDPVWVARIYASLFWIIGGLALYFLTSAMTSPDGGILALAYFLFVPFGIIASRSFQPDPLMVMFMLLSFWAVYYWYRKPTWGHAILAGVLTGLALFVKATALFPVFFGLAGFFLFSRGIKKAIRDPQVWLIAGLSVLPMIAYHIYGVYILGTLESQFEGRFFPALWRDIGFYFNWEDMATGIAGYGAIMVAVLGILLFKKPGMRGFAAGLWLGYFIYGMGFPYHITTHSYYHLPLLAIVAICLAPVGATLLQPLTKLKFIWLVRLFVVAILFFAIVIKVWGVRLDLAIEDYRNEPAYWQNIAEILGPNSSVIGLTEDYGNRLTYYGYLTPRIWLPSGALAYRNLKGKPPIEVQKWFADKTENRDYFLVTMLKQLDKQPELQQILYDNYLVYSEGPGYIIFDLRHPLSESTSPP